MKNIIFESPVEAVINSHSFPYTSNIIDQQFREKSAIMVFKELNKGNPAFIDWSKRIKSGEKLPRGKFFRKEELMRNWRTPFKLDGKVKYITVHASQE